MNLKQTSFLLALAAAVVGGVLPASAQLTIPSDGSDGTLNITTNTVIDLAQATDGAWNATGNGKGVYDSDKWAVVFKYSSVNIASGATVTFTNHRTHAPVVWLVQGNVTINGTVDLSGKDGTSDALGALTPTEPGPGGFRGGPGGPSGYGAGYGPGGGVASEFAVASNGQYAGVYGNPQIIPLIGGSGSGGNTFSNSSGPAGGGAILIATPNTVAISGNILAKGGSGANSFTGSGGAVRIIASNVTGSGTINTTRDGRIRIETNSMAPTVITAPETIGVAPANPPIIWPAANAPKARVVSVDSINAPTDPYAPLIAAADVAIQNNSPVNIVLETRDFPIEGVVQLHVIPKFGNRTILNATRIGGNITQATWRVTTALPQGFVTLQARATQP